MQGRAHLEVFTELFKWSKVYLWSRNKQNAIDLQSKFNNAEILVDLNDIRIQQSDVICTCTGSEKALIGLPQVKNDVHINGIINRFFSKIMIIFYLFSCWFIP